MHWEILLAFAATNLLFAFSPGPAVLLTVSHGMKGGVRDAAKVALGVQAGNGVYFALSALGLGAVLQASELTEIAEGRAPSNAVLEPRLITPADCGYEIRGGGNATRQIVDILPPAFPADKLLICEVFTPSGNWSSYPPHKHDVDNPPVEVDLEEIYYYRMKQPHGYGLQRLYTADGSRDETVKVEDGDVVLVPDGYHPYVSAYGIDSYYLNVLAGTRRSMAASDDPRYAAVRSSWPAPDPRMPMIPKP